MEFMESVMESPLLGAHVGGQSPGPGLRLSRRGLRD
jgi:hypothetical protein